MPYTYKGTSKINVFMVYTTNRLDKKNLSLFLQFHNLLISIFWQGLSDCALRIYTTKIPNSEGNP